MTALSCQPILTYLEALSSEGFWGSVTLKFENGHPVHVREEQNFKPNELPRRRMFNDASQETS